jgi:NADH-quinone oxidoreductase subunit K
MDQLAPVVTLSMLLFGIGILLAVIRRSLVSVLIGIELMLGAGNLLLVAFNRHWAGVDPQADVLAGQTLALFVISVSAAQIAVGLAVLVGLFKNRNSLNIDEVNLLRW